MAQQRTSIEPYVLQAGEGQAIWFLTNRMTVKASSELTGGGIMILDVQVAPGGTAPWHVHRREDELFFVLEGRVRFRVAEREFEAGPGALVFLPRDIPHSYLNLGDTEARWLTITVPGGAEGFFIDSGVPALDETIQVQPLDPARLGAVAARYGVEILGPPPFGARGD